jgi:argininosuccinate lyase
MEQTNNNTLWQKNSLPLAAVEAFTVGNDKQFDAQLARYDVLGSLAHVQMLHSVGLLDEADTKAVTTELKAIYRSIEAGDFAISETAEDIHSHIELLLTQKLGEAGKKIHSARSRNDQVLVDIKLFLRHQLQLVVTEVKILFDLLQRLSEKHKTELLPGYTHLQMAMPSSFGLWLGAYAESLADDTVTLKAAYDIANKNPLGSAAGYGSSFPINRSLTTQLLGFADLHYNVVYAQMGRGKTERIVAMALTNVADTLSKLSMDACLMLNQHFAFISFPDELTTGSSIMPHKKNPDVFELIRSHCNRIKALPNEIMLMTTNLPSGYHRDLQLLKEHLFPAFDNLRHCLQMTGLMLGNMQVQQNILTDEKYKYLFSVEEVNKLVANGMPFRDAYKQVGLAIEKGTYQYSTAINHTHEGSIGNLCNEKIKAQMDVVLGTFPFKQVEAALERLVGI